MYTTIKGLKINYREAGEGDLVCLLHGWGADSSLYENIMNVIAARYKVVAPDFPGFGGSEEPPAAWSVDDYADFVVEFLHQFKRKKVILLGHSYGGRVIIKLSARKNLPFAIVKNILVDAAGIMPHRSLAYKLRVRLYKLGKAVLNFPLMTKLFPDALNRFQKKFGSADYAAASPVMRGSLVKAVNEDLEPLLPQITAETLLIWGDKDTATPVSDGRKMEKQIKGSGLVVFSGAGHYSFLEQPYLFAKVIKSFLNIGD